MNVALHRPVNIMRIYFFVVNVPVVRLVTVVLAVILANSCHQIPVVKSILLAVTALSAKDYDPNTINPLNLWDANPSILLVPAIY